MRSWAATSTGWWGERTGQSPPRGEAGAVLRVLESEDRGRAERPDGEGREIPRAVRVAPPRPGRRAVLRGARPLPHGIPRAPRVGGAGGIPHRAAGCRTSARGGR